MKISNQNKDELIAKFLSGNISSEEISELNKWELNFPDSKKVIQKSKKVWEASKYSISDKEKELDRVKVLHAIQNQQSKKLIVIRRKLLLYKVAAILVFPITLALFWYFSQKDDLQSTDEYYCEVSAPQGHVAKCILPDSSEVWLNTGSTISYNVAAFNHEVREIHLEGEAYFDVSKNKEKPFRVITEMANVNVTGTSFNVKMYDESKHFEVVLAEGSVEMVPNKQNFQKVNLKPGERVVYEENRIGIDEVDPDFFTSWRNGEILFKDATLNDLIRELERIYDIKFHLRDSNLGDFRFRGMFSYNNNLIEALEKIKKTANISYYIENKEVWLYK